MAVELAPATLAATLSRFATDAWPVNLTTSGAARRATKQVRFCIDAGQRIGPMPQPGTGAAQSSRSRALIAVFARVCASTRLTMMAAVRL